MNDLLFFLWFGALAIIVLLILSLIITFRSITRSGNDRNKQINNKIKHLEQELKELKEEKK